MNLKQWVCSFQKKNKILESSILLKTIFKNIELRESVNLIDIGAYHGEFYQQIKWHRKINKALLVDPVNENIEIIKKRFPEVLQLEAAIASRNEDISFYQNVMGVTSSIFKFEETSITNNISKETKRTLQVKACTFDRLVEQFQFTAIDIVKVDVQGAEMEVLKGISIENFSKIRLLILEVSFKRIYQQSVLYNEIFEFIEAKGFIMLNMEPVYYSATGELLQADVIFKNPMYLQK